MTTSAPACLAFSSCAVMSTSLMLYFSTATNLNNKADYMKFLSGNSSSNPAQLIITYTLP